ncbi:hypothetical protein NUW58_g2051 [Xylaria curta]|uniref:Uncharacterized protein n=1 Tax=Xylaria curta TaxID=42375 RepID=A0ACC1PJ26_9PEZI|nr:hypothetical protein NUW58_g2051 [Xylaria curta]
MSLLNIDLRERYPLLLLIDKVSERWSKLASFITEGSYRPADVPKYRFRAVEARHCQPREGDAATGIKAQDTRLSLCVGTTKSWFEQDDWEAAALSSRLLGGSLSQCAYQMGGCADLSEIANHEAQGKPRETLAIELDPKLPLSAAGWVDAILVPEGVRPLDSHLGFSIIDMRGSLGTA